MTDIWNALVRVSLPSVDKEKHFSLNANVDYYYSAEEMHFALQHAGIFGQFEPDDETFLCLNQNSKGCPQDGKLLAFTTLAVYLTNADTNCLNCEWKQQRLQEIKEGPTTPSPALESNTAALFK